MPFILYLYDENGSRTKIDSFTDPLLAGREGLRLLSEYRKDIEQRKIKTFSVTIKDENEKDHWNYCTSLIKMEKANG